MKKILSLLIGLSLMLTMFPVAADTAAEPSENIAFASVNGTQTTGFTSVKLGSADNKLTAVRDMKSGWAIEKSLATAQRYLYFDLDDKFAHEVADGSVFDIEIEYYSEENGFFEFQYDSTITEAVRGGVTEVGNDKMWKSVKYTIDDAYFGGRLAQGADFTITTSYLTQTVSGRSYFNGNVIIGDVTVTKHTAKNPITLKASIDEAGNTFSWFEEKIIHNTFTNTTDKTISADVTYMGCDTNGYTVSHTEKLTVNAGETTVVDYKIDTERCGLFTYTVDIKSDEYGINSHFEPLEFVILKTDPDGIKNEKHYLNTHFTPPQNPLSVNDVRYGMEIVAKSNVGGVRESFESAKYMPALGSVNHPERHAVLVDLLRENNMKVLPILNMHNPAYGVADASYSIKTLAEGDKVTGVQAWLDWLIPEIADIADVYEQQNEPNARVYRGEIGIPESAVNYTSWAKAMYPVIKKHDPDALYMIGCLAYAESEKTYEWVEELLKNGIGEYSDAMSYHPYVHWTPYERGVHKTTAQTYRDIYKKYGYDNLRLFDSETGDTVSDWSKPDHETVGNYIVRRFIYQQMEDISEIHCTYCFEKAGPLLSDRENQFGITGPTLSGMMTHNVARNVPTIAFVEMTAMDYWLAQAELEDYTQPDSNTYIAEFDSQKFGGKVAVLWSVSDFDISQNSKSVTVDLGCSSLTYSDAYGNTVEMKSDDGRYTFTLTGQPIYIQGDFDEVKVAETPDFYFDSNMVQTVIGDVMEVNVKANVPTERMSVETYAPYLLAQTGTQEFVDDTATLTYDLAEGYIGKAQLQIKLLKDGNVCSVYDIPISVGDAVESSVDKSIAPGNDYNRWKLDFMITNNYASKAMKGKLTVKAPQEFANAIGTVDIGVIPRSKTAKISVNTPVVYEKKIYNIEYQLTLEDGQVYSFEESVDFTLAGRTKTDVVIDGKITTAEWNMDTAMVSDTADRVKLIPDWSGVRDLSAKTMLQWDDENLYLFARVTDNIFNQKNNDPSKLWDGDSIQFGVYKEAEEFIISGQGGSNFNEITMGLMPDGTAAAYKQKDQYNNPENVGVIEDCELVILRDEQLGVTTYEFAIPWDTLFGQDEEFKTGDKIGFSILYNDDDGSGRRGWIEYASGIGSSKNTAMFTYVLLLD